MNNYKLVLSVWLNFYNEIIDLYNKFTNTYNVDIEITDYQIIITNSTLKQELDNE